MKISILLPIIIAIQVNGQIDTAYIQYIESMYVFEFCHVIDDYYEIQNSYLFYGTDPTEIIPFFDHAGTNYNILQSNPNLYTMVGVLEDYIYFNNSFDSTINLRSSDFCRIKYEPIGSVVKYHSTEIYGRVNSDVIYISFQFRGLVNVYSGDVDTLWKSMYPQFYVNEDGYKCYSNLFNETYTQVAVLNRIYGITKLTDEQIKELEFIKLNWTDFKVHLRF